MCRLRNRDREQAHAYKGAHIKWLSALPKITSACEKKVKKSGFNLARLKFKCANVFGEGADQQLHKRLF
jgi:hypothetical protein